MYSLRPGKPWGEASGTDTVDAMPRVPGFESRESALGPGGANLEKREGWWRPEPGGVGGSPGRENSETGSSGEMERQLTPWQGALQMPMRRRGKSRFIPEQ